MTEIIKKSKIFFHRKFERKSTGNSQIDRRNRRDNNKDNILINNFGFNEFFTSERGFEFKNPIDIATIIEKKTSQLLMKILDPINGAKTDFLQRLQRIKKGYLHVVYIINGARLSDGHLARFPHGAVQCQRPSSPRTQFIDNANSPFKKELTFTSLFLNHESHPGEEAARRKNQNRNYKQFDCIVVELC